MVDPASATVLVVDDEEGMREVAAAILRRAGYHVIAVRSGFAGYDNPTHHGIYDFAYWRGLPNLRVMYPKDRFELERPDVWPVDDFGVRKGFGRIFSLPEAPTPRALEALGEQFRPFRSVVAWYCWRAAELPELD